MFACKYRGNIDHSGPVGGQRDTDLVTWTELQLAFAVERDRALAQPHVVGDTGRQRLAAVQPHWLEQSRCDWCQHRA